MFLEKWGESRSVVSDSLRHHRVQSMEFSRPEYWSGLLFPSPGDVPNWGIEPRSPALQADSLPAEWQPTPVFLPGKFHGLRSLAGCSLWGHKELDTTEWITLLFHFSGHSLEIQWRGKDQRERDRDGCYHRVLVVAGGCLDWSRLMAMEREWWSYWDLVTESMWSVGK